MTAHEWKPGAVAMVTCSDGKERRAICGRRAVDDGRVWLFRDGTRRDAETSHARPLVVIDPEDRDAVDRLADAFCDARWSHTPGSEECDPLTRSSMQAALREFANPTPPKPEEPTGLGAVVEDARGDQWVRALPDGGPAKWRVASLDLDREPWAVWSAIDAVRVLSEGVAR